MVGRDAELEEIRRRKMEQMLQAQMKEAEEEEKKKEIEAARRNILRQILTSEARERLNSIKMVKPEFAEMIENQLIALAQSGKIKGMINDDKLKEILRQVMPRKREITIRRI
ncbi:MAG: DNA-binding protein [Candidatus Methanospirareceae archaeon]